MKDRREVHLRRIAEAKDKAMTIAASDSPPDWLLARSLATDLTNILTEARALGEAAAAEHVGED